MHGWLIVDKPLGLTSAGVVGRVKGMARRAGWAKVKVGHGGTLDPLATGVLPIALGDATKLCGRMLDSVKAYRFTVALGVATATDDAEGAVVAVSDARPALDEVAAVLGRFTGEIAQRPPAYSALKVAGERAYKLARAGEAVVLAARVVTIHSLTLHARPETIERLTLAVVCSKGTYVRSLARDIALALGTVGHVAALRRTRAGPFGEDAATPLDTLQTMCERGGLADAFLPLTAGLDDIPALAVDPDEAFLLRQGRRLAGRSGRAGLHVAMLQATPVALVEVSPDGVRVERGFNLSDKE